MRPPSRAELGWIGRLDRWYGYRHFPTDCETRLTSLVGRPPTPRLKPYFARSSLACTHFQQWRQARLDHNATIARKELHQGVAITKRVESGLHPLRPGMRTLPRRNGFSMESRIVPRYGQVAAVISVTAHVRVRCWSAADWDDVVRQFTAYIGRPAPDLLGFVIRPQDVNLSPTACEALDELTFERDRPKDPTGLDQLAQGINTLAHESEHLANPRSSESVVECYGMQDVPHAMQLLGGSERYGMRLARAYYHDLYPHQPPAYRTRACRHGGSLDADPWGPSSVLGPG